VTLRAAAAGAALIGSGLYLWQALRYPVGTIAAPGAGLYPAAVGLFLVLAAATLALQGVRAGRPQPGAETGDEKPLAGAQTRVATAIVCLLGFSAALPWAGYPLSAFALVTALLQRLGGGRWYVAAIGGVVTAGASHYVFSVLLGVPLPRGVLVPGS
jgi:putative tricarboxylic transport membrane protein